MINYHVEEEIKRAKSKRKIIEIQNNYIESMELALLNFTNKLEEMGVKCITEDGEFVWFNGNPYGEDLEDVEE